MFNIKQSVLFVSAFLCFVILGGFCHSSIVNVPFTGDISNMAYDADGDPITFSKESGSDWLVVASNGSLSGIPPSSAIGENRFTVRVEDPSGASDEATLIINVAATSATFNYMNDISGTAVDDDGDTITYSMTSGPDWLTIDPDGSIYGTPSDYDVGENRWIVRATDSDGAWDEATMIINVIDYPEPPVFDIITTSVIVEDVFYSDSISDKVTDPDSVHTTQTFIFEKISGPVWLSVATTGGLSGTPFNDDVGINTFQIRVTDQDSLFDTAIKVIRVINANDPPRFLNDPFYRPDATEE